MYNGIECQYVLIDPGQSVLAVRHTRREHCCTKMMESEESVNEADAAVAESTNVIRIEPEKDATYCSLDGFNVDEMRYFVSRRILGIIVKCIELLHCWCLTWESIKNLAPKWEKPIR